MVDACVAQSKVAGGVNPLSAQIAGIVNFTNPAAANFCMPQAATSTVENLFPYNPTNSQSYSLNPVTAHRATTGWRKWIMTSTSTTIWMASCIISRETTVAAALINPTGALTVSGAPAEYAGAWTWTPNSTWVNDLRGGAAPNSGNSVAADTAVTPANAYTGVGSGYGVNTGATGFGLTCIDDQRRFPGHHDRPGELRQEWDTRAAVPARFHR